MTIFSDDDVVVWACL